MIFFMKIHIIAKPRSKIAKINHIGQDIYNLETYEIYISSIPKDWEANSEIIKSLAKFFDKTQSQIKIISWHKGKDKIIEIL